MTKFRPCIDLHAGQVKQIVGGTLNDVDDSELRVNFTSEYDWLIKKIVDLLRHNAAHYARLYRQNQLDGGHIIMLGPGNEPAARSALSEWDGNTIDIHAIISV
jgi:phosphoribosylformimino-5-aminoimidazole carboxamide ribotide isomerase